jgi:putative transposase
MVGSFKSAAARRINMLRGTRGAPVWQRGFYEHVVRDEEDLDRIRGYIEANPQRWSEDEENPEHRVP